MKIGRDGVRTRTWWWSSSRSAASFFLLPSGVLMSNSVSITSASSLSLLLSSFTTFGFFSFFFLAFFDVPEDASPPARSVWPLLGEAWLVDLLDISLLSRSLGPPLLFFAPFYNAPDMPSPAESTCLTLRAAILLVSQECGRDLTIFGMHPPKHLISTTMTFSWKLLSQKASCLISVYHNNIWQDMRKTSHENIRPRRHSRRTHKLPLKDIHYDFRKTSTTRSCKHIESLPLRDIHHVLFERYLKVSTTRRHS